MPRSEERVAVYRDVPIHWNGAAYVVRLVSPTGGRVTVQRATLAAARRAVSEGLNKGFSAPPSAAVRSNPALTIFANPGGGGQLLSKRALEVAYTHATDGLDYVHKFARGVHIAFLPDGSARLWRPDGKPVWKDF